MRKIYLFLVGYLFFDEICSLFFTILNIDIDPTSDISLYVYLKIFYGLISVIYCLTKIIIERKTTSFFIVIFMLTMLLIILLFITSMRYSNTPISRSTLITLGYLIPFFILCGVIIPKIDLEKISIRIPYIILSLFVSGMIGIVIPNIQGETVNSLNGFTYQNTSYFFSMGFLLTLIHLLKNSQRERIRIRTYFYTFLLIFFLVLSFIGGGKGALVTNIFAFSLYSFYSKITLKRFLYIIFCCVIGYLVILNISNKNIELYSGIERALSFLSLDMQTLWDNSSGRESIYNITIGLISQKPILGWGIGSSNFTILRSYPHNLFLEILLDGGIVYFLIFLAAISSTLSTLYRKAKNDLCYIFILSCFLFDFLSLQFSGSYLFGNYFFWFGLLLNIYILFFGNKIRSYEEVSHI
ncbi:O-antigen ligase family protein [Enterococcus sp. CR-Ec1]|uniref:O-antigen ligase family protein n=1 Tax=Enterococcus sp. CR-Ec1 TaxID=2057791 RepID=UPI000C76AF0E|nr:O-antigen ligase family protein [Enterococcus sp. CR-Ec1]AUJ86085.1 hypothetical protein CXM95_11670 [Enterococcus sp. CR-Ec1]